MTFDQWIKKKNITYDEAARLIGVSNATAARRYAVGGRLPQPEIMRRIYEVTGGAVSPNDFYHLPEAAHAA